jgi:N-acetyltransferase
MTNVLGQTAASASELPRGLRLRQLEPGDRARVTALAADWWDHPVPGLLPRPFFSEFRDTSFVIEDGPDLAAFLVGFASQSDPDTAYIHAVAVAPGLRGHGIGRFLYDRFVETARRHGRRRVRAVTGPHNATSLAFHRRLGFRIAAASSADRGDAHAELELELAAPASIDFVAGNAQLAAQTLAQPLLGTVIALEPLERRHRDALARAAATGDWSLMPVDALSPAAFDRWLEWMLANRTKGPAAAFAVLRRDEERAIGSTSFHAVYPEHRRVEIGMTWYARSEWGSGANVEAKLLMLDRAFTLGFRRVEFKTDARNLRSRRALEALPAQFEGVMRKHMLVRGGERRDSAYYSVIDDDWPDVRANLEQRLVKRTARPS